MPSIPNHHFRNIQRAFYSKKVRMENLKQQLIPDFNFIFKFPPLYNMFLVREKKYKSKRLSSRKKMVTNEIQ